MANQWHAYGSAVTFVAAKTMIDIFNAPVATRVLRILRMYQYNTPVAATAQTLSTMELRRITDTIGGTFATMIPQNASNRMLEMAATVGTGRTITQATAPNLLRRYLWSVGDITSTQGSGLNSFELAIPFSEVWDAGCYDSVVQPLVARKGEGYALINSAGGASFNSFGIDFTDDDS